MCYIIIPPLHRRWNGVYWIHPDVCPSVCRRVSGTFWKNYWLNSFHTWHLHLWVSLLTPIHFRVPSLIFGPLVAKYLAENGISGTFWKNCWLNSFHTWHLSLWGESLDPYTFFVFLASFLALWWPNIWPKMGFPELFEKTIGSIHFFPWRIPTCTQLQNRNLYWIFLDEVGSDQSGVILFSFMGTACYTWYMFGNL